LEEEASQDAASKEAVSKEEEVTQDAASKPAASKEEASQDAASKGEASKETQKLFGRYYYSVPCLRDLAAVAIYCHRKSAKSR
jgi:hypothetical protein